MGGSVTSSPDRIVARSRMADIEDRLGVEPIEELLARRAALIDQIAPLRALYGPGGTFEHQRKSKLAVLSALVRAQAVRDKRKTTEAQLEEEARCHADYADMITQATTDRAQLERLSAQVEAIDQTIQRGNVVARYATAEARLT